MGSYKPRHLKHEPSLVSNLVSKRGLAVAAATATVVPVIATESASAAPVSAAAPVTARAANVSYGASGYYVTLLQQRLNVHGSRLVVDGRFGPATYSQLVAFQKRYRAVVTGTATDQTWRALLSPNPYRTSRSTTTTRPVATSGIVSIAKQYTGVPYVWGGTTPSGFDCSGFTQYVYRKAGKYIPRTASAQQAAVRRVSTPAAGDLIFSGFPAYHVSIYVSPGYEIAASRPGTTIRVKPIYGYKTYGRA
ncbi:C40 family peptidase [Yimella sp. cx-51]|uniref:C40 family peptidase n=1 Tax=Yimella sp. cx-51 TaxID=2770551 RepID=UPI00272A19A8|nr:NlpC/P60 family protein [Yimella sp. cx-51]